MTTLIPRAFAVDLAGLPRHWFAGNAVATAIGNGVNLLFPIGERYFVRSVNHFLDQIDDPGLRAQVRGFFGQEGRHARAHDQLIGVMRAQGFEVDRFLAVYEAVLRWIEDRVSPELNLAGTAAAEHFTAILADGAFNRGILELMEPRMQHLLAWHAAEEIEHKAVAFDVLRKVDPSYALRMAGLVYATAMLGGFWLGATIVLVRQDKLGWRQALQQLAAMRGSNSVLRRVFVAGIRDYVRRSFHPSDHANEDLAARWFAAHGLAMPEAA